MKNTSILKTTRLCFYVIGIYTIIICVCGLLIVNGTISTTGMEWLFILLMVISCASGVVAAHIICNAIRRPLGYLSEIGKALADGNTEIDVSKESADEFGIVINQFAKAVKATKEQAETMLGVKIEEK